MTLSHPVGATARTQAAQVLDAVLHHGRSLKFELASALPALPDSRDRALTEAICFAALRQRTRYGAALAAWMPKPLPKRDEPLRALLYAGFAQLDPLGLPQHAAVSATVEATRALGRPHQAGLVNALLRRAIREGLPEAQLKDAWPEWLLKHLQRDWPDDIDKILQASAQPGPLWLRVNRNRTERDAYAQRLYAEGLTCETYATLTDAIRLHVSVPVDALPGFATGDVSVQDGAAQRVADAFSLPPNARVLDACAAPGGKTAHLLERQPGLRITALDIEARRISIVRNTLQRVGASAVLRIADASALDTWWDGIEFDAILLDVPCSATGIVRRQPDILLHRRSTDLEHMLVSQALLLDTTWRTLKPGGVMVYATCSILKAENQDQIAAFLARTPDANVDALDDAFGHLAGFGRQRLPGEDGMDGFFYARFVKQA